ncbi:MAG: hypothetical protein QOK05_508 [Chloroflexota bacterium]|nr:hypothetical protein [Chloroflexota bacterium]
MAFSKAITLEDVHRIKRPGLGYIYRGKITVGDLFGALNEGDVRYAPRYQRGYKPGAEVSEAEYDQLVDIKTKDLNIERPRAQAIAAKYLMAIAGEGNKVLYNPDVIWNARRDPHRRDPQYEPDQRVLQIYSAITIPDSGHRHFAYYLIGAWHAGVEPVPDAVVIEPTSGESVPGEKLREWLNAFNPYDVEDSSILVEVFNLDKEQEGRLFDEYNDESKPASNAASIDLYDDKTPSRRFVSKLMASCRIFSRAEIETRSNTIGSKSRKLTTNATMEAAIRPFSKKLLELERQEGFDDLVSFFCAFYEEWGAHYPVYLPESTAEARQALRTKSFALSNVIFFPMFRLAFDLWWKKYKGAKAEWRRDNSWKDALAKLAGEVEIEVESGAEGAKTKRTVKVPVMARDVDGDEENPGNPAWRERVLVPKFDRQGKLSGWTLSSTRVTRDAAYSYLRDVSGLRDVLD